MRAKNFSKIKKNLKNLAAIAALSTLLIGVFAIPGAMALDIELNTDGVEEAICDAIDGPNDSGLFQCSDESGSSFTDFEGEFDAPDEEGYAEGITTTSSAREFVVNVTNFVLQFLGLSAIVVIIYGGFMYVTSAGEQERAEKGKKSVMYAVIGILVVLISYALVNTIIQGAAGGEDATSSDGLYSSSGVSSDSLSEFQAAEMAESLEDLTQAYIEEYTIFTNVSAIMDAMANVPHFGADGLAELEEGFELILDEVDSFSDTADYAKEALQEIRRYISLNFTDRVLQFVDVKEWGQASVLQMSVLLAEESSIEEEADACIDDCKDDYGAFNSSRYSCIAACTNEADATEENDPYEVAGEMIEYMSLTSSMSATEFAYAMIDIQNDLEDMQTSFENIETIRALFDEAIEGFDTYISSSYDATTYSYDYIASGGYTSASIYEGPPGGASHLGDVIEMLNEIHGLIKELEFTTAIISANTDKGNAPLVVSFNALDSYDPTDLTIPDENYVWDLYGNGFDTNVSDVNGNPDNTTGANVSYTYSEPGTYRVALRVDSNDPENIASGISYLSVKVSPPSSVIRLTATPEGDTSLAITLKDADQDINETSWTITGETAEQGITFDASGTTDANGDNTIVEYDFDFGDGESQTGEDDTAIHYYTEEGTFEFELEVTDQNGNKDRAIVNITVASPAASIKASQTNVEIGDTVYFDGSGSLTDNGNITNYHWIIEDDDYEDENGDEDLYYTFDSPGSYTVTLEVTDSSGLSNEASVIVTVNSTEPVATFSWDIPDSKAPYRVNFDGTKSYDDDDEDILSYEWLIAGTEGIDYDYAESTSATSAKPIVYFYSVGNWDVTLTVRDQYLDELQQENSYKKTITVTSVLGIAVEDSNGSSIAFLEPTYDADGNVGGAVATISLDLESNYGVSYKIDWADVSSVETVPVSSVGSTQSVTHNYDTAGTYPVNITVYSSDGDTNSMTHNVFIGNGEEPIPVITVTMNDLSPADENNITGDRTTSFKFDATKSVDLDGSALASGSYSWNLGDGTTISSKSVTHSYDELGEFEVTLSVQSEIDSSVTSSTTVTITIEEAKPVIYGLIAKPQNDELITPLSVKLIANAEDPDGEIVHYKFYYFDVNNSSKILGSQISLSEETYITVNTNGVSKEINEYGFAVEVTDGESNTVSSIDELTESQMPTLEIENGPNVSPTAELTVDSNNILVGDTVTFSAAASDDDGKIVSYTFDVEGDGFYNNDATTDSTITYTYETSAPSGIEVRVKVEDDGGATSTSDEVRIYVDTLTQDPEAAFTYETDNLVVTFQNNSSADSSSGATIASYEWDFDAATDSDGNGDKLDDVDSTEENPTHTYETYDTYRVVLRIMDSEGNTGDVTNSIKVIEVDPPQAAFTYAIDGYTVTFDDGSSVNAANVYIAEYHWDFDTDTDSDGNGERDNDEDSTSQNPSHTYEEYGRFKVELTIVDSLGRSDSVEQSIDIEEPEVDELEAFLTSSPATSPNDGKIHLDSPSGNVTFTFSSTGGAGTITYCIDKNVYFDSDGNGDKDDDCNNKTTNAGSYTTDFDESWGLIVAKLTVTDEAGGEYTVTKEIKFDKQSTVSVSTSLMPVTTLEALYILATALTFTYLGAKFYTRKEEPVEEFLE